MSEAFDRIKFEDKIRDTFEPRKLFDLTEDLAGLRKHYNITMNEFEELVDTIKTKIREVEAARKMLVS